MDSHARCCCWRGRRHQRPSLACRPAAGFGQFFRRGSGTLTPRQDWTISSPSHVPWRRCRGCRLRHRAGLLAEDRSSQDASAYRPISGDGDRLGRSGHACMRSDQGFRIRLSSKFVRLRYHPPPELAAATARSRSERVKGLERMPAAPPSSGSARR